MDIGRSYLLGSGVLLATHLAWSTIATKQKVGKMRLGLFGKNEAWGVEIGCRFLRAVKLGWDARRQRLLLLAIDRVELPEGSFDPTPELVKAMKSMANRHGMHKDPICFAPQAGFIVRRISPPPMNLRQLDKMVHYEMRQTLPFSLEDVNWDYHAFWNLHENTSPEFILCVGRRDVIKNSCHLFNQSGLRVKGAQPPSVALYNAMFTDRLLEGHGDLKGGLKSCVGLLRPSTKEIFVVLAGFESLDRRSFENEHVGEEGKWKEIVEYLKAKSDGTLVKCFGVGELSRRENVATVIRKGLHDCYEPIRSFRAVKEEDYLCKLPPDDLSEYYTAYGLALGGLQRVPISVNLLKSRKPNQSWKRFWC